MKSPGPKNHRPRRSACAEASLQAEMERVDRMTIEERIKAALSMGQQFSSVMSHPIELPDPLFREINGYAIGNASSPVQVIEQAWQEFRARHAQPVPPAEKLKVSGELKARIKALRGSISLAEGKGYDQLREDAVEEKYGPF